jgi:hypothetical protein
MMLEGVLLKTEKPSKRQPQIIRMTQQDFHNSMKKLIIFLSLWLGFMQVVRCEVDVSYDPSDWPHHTVRFPNEGTLKDIFDAGIRPYRFPSLERTALGFKHVNVAFEMRTGEFSPKFPVEWADLDILKGGLISSIEMTSPNLSPQQAELAMIPYLKYGKRTTEQLRAFLAAAANDPRGYDDPYKGDASKFAISWIDTNGPAYDVFFKSTFDNFKPVSIALKISFFPIRTPLQERSFYDVSIPPPTGYENVSMEAPRNFGPDSAVEIARSKGIPITGDRTQEEYERQQREANGKPRYPKLEVSSVEPKPKSPDNSEIWIWLIALIGFITAALLVRCWRSKSTP